MQTKISRQKTAEDFAKFQKRVDAEIMTHRVIHDNQYTKWFEQGDISLQQAQHFATQFSVFSNLFIIAQLKKVINSESLEEMHRAKEILMNELGVVFNRKTQESEAARSQRANNAEAEGDPAYVNTEGTIEGGTFKFRAAHFEWLLDFAKPLGLGFQDLGKRRHGSKTTVHFTDALENIYASPEFSEAAGASYAIENWAAAGFWKQLIIGLKKFKDQQQINLPISFFTWHDKVEDQHAAHTQEELKEVYFYPEFNEDQFVKSGKAMLDACAVFWDGLEKDRK